MKNKSHFLVVLVLLTAVAVACNWSTANMSELKRSKDAEGRQATTSFKAGETIHEDASIANNPGEVTVNFRLVDDDAPGETIKGSEISVDIEKDAAVKYTLPIPEGAPRANLPYSQICMTKPANERTENQPQ
ncbi:MAG: hypothetical protein H0V76_08700 [Blastocatellia bacterium]|nr:hypothetical protein [Blastocatellia bacterium]